MLLAFARRSTAAIMKQHVNVYARKILIPCRSGKAAGGEDKSLQLKASESGILKAIQLLTT